MTLKELLDITDCWVEIFDEKENFIGQVDDTRMKVYGDYKVAFITMCGAEDTLNVFIKDRAC